MQEVDINTLGDSIILNKYIPNNIIIVGKIDILIINIIHDYLDLSRVECNKITYYNQRGDSIKNHILPNSLVKLYCASNNITSLPDLPNSLKELICSNNNITSLPELPNSLKELYCSKNQLTSLPKLPNSLKELWFDNNQLIELPILPNSLKILHCNNNELKSLPDLTHINHKLTLSFTQDSPIEYITYSTNIELYTLDPNKIIIEGYSHNPITNQEELEYYMEKIRLSKIKSAKK